VPIAKFVISQRDVAALGVQMLPYQKFD